MKKLFSLNRLIYMVLFAILFFLCFNLFKVDHKRRKIELSADNIHVLVNKKEWTKDNIELTIKYDGSVSSDIDSYSFDGGNTWTKSNLYIVENSGKINILIKDVLGRIFDASYDVNNIDKNGPVIEAEKDIMVFNNSSFNIKDYIEISDIGIGLKDVKIKNKINTSKIGIQKTTVEAIDKLGNSTSKTIQVEIVKKGKKIKAKSIECNDYITIKKNQKKKLKINIYPRITSDKKLFYKSTNNKIVTISKKGIIKAKKTGSAAIIVTTKNGIKAECAIKVSD